MKNTTKNIDDLRENFRNFFSKSNLTQNELAKKLNMPQSQISFFLTGKRGLGGEHALRLLKFINEQNALD